MMQFRHSYFPASLNLSDRAALDSFEGAGAGYESKTIHVETNAGPVEALTYVATNKQPELLPFHWYKRHVLVGTREANLPAEYIRAIESTASVDLCPERIWVVTFGKNGVVIWDHASGVMQHKQLRIWG
jgi:hypothetical protein